MIDEILIKPCFNCYKTSIKIIRSIRNQIYRKYEIILAGNLSSDNSINIAKDLANIDKKFIYSNDIINIKYIANKKIKRNKSINKKINNKIINF